MDTDIPVITIGSCYAHTTTYGDESLALVFSNLAMVPGVILAWRRSLYMECVIYFFTFLWSTLYHSCKSMKWCVLSSLDTYYFMDYGFSYAALSTTMIMLFHPIALESKPALMTFHLTIAMWVAISDFDSHGFYGPGVLTIAIALTLLVIVRPAAMRLRLKEINSIDGMIALLMTLVGVTAKALDFFQVMEFWIVHSLWHLFIMGSVYFWVASITRSHDVWFRLPKPSLEECQPLTQEPAGQDCILLKRMSFSLQW